MTMGCGCSGSKNGKPNSVPKPRPPKPAAYAIREPHTGATDRG